MTRLSRLIFLVSLTVAILLGGLGGFVVRGAVPDPQAALSTAFTYQGRLLDGTVPTNGSYSFTFRLFDALTGGAQIGSTAALPSVPVVDGLFTVQLDFGPTAFTGSARYLEVQVGSTILSPRQALTAAPYALYASKAGSVPWSGLTGARWDLRGAYTLDFNCVAQCVAGINPHAMTITAMDLTTGAFSGTGVFLTNTAYTWTVSGILNGDQFTMTLVYNALNPGYTVETRGSIAPDGRFSGIGKSNTGEAWTVFSTSGAAQQP